MRDMENHIDDLASRDIFVDNAFVTDRVLDIRVQPGGYQDAASLITYGIVAGVEVRISEF